MNLLKSRILSGAPIIEPEIGSPISSKLPIRRDHLCPAHAALSLSTDIYLFCSHEINRCLTVSEYEIGPPPDSLSIPNANHAG